MILQRDDVISRRSSRRCRPRRRAVCSLHVAQILHLHFQYQLTHVLHSYLCTHPHIHTQPKLLEGVCLPYRLIDNHWLSFSLSLVLSFCFTRCRETHMQKHTHMHTAKNMREMPGDAVGDILEAADPNIPWLDRCTVCIHWVEQSVHRRIWHSISFLLLLFKLKRSHLRCNAGGSLLVSPVATCKTS